MPSVGEKISAGGLQKSKVGHFQLRPKATLFYKKMRFYAMLRQALILI
jgi:hypothetical protein